MNAGVLSRTKREEGDTERNERASLFALVKRCAGCVSHDGFLLFSSPSLPGRNPTCVFMLPSQLLSSLTELEAMPLFRGDMRASGTSASPACGAVISAVTRVRSVDKGLCAVDVLFAFEDGQKEKEKKRRLHVHSCL